MNSSPTVDKTRKRIAIFYSPELGGAWLTHLVRKSSDSRHDFFHVVVGEPRADLVESIQECELPLERIHYRGKSDLIKAILQASLLLRKLKISVIHTHGLPATLIGLVAARFSGVGNRIYTRHHSTLHHEEGPRHTTYYDRLSNHLATKIIATSTVVKDCLTGLEGVPEKKILFQSYRFDLDRFTNVPGARVTEMRQKYDIPSDNYVVGMVSRFVRYKGVEHGVAAFREFRKHVPESLLLLVNARGPWKHRIWEELKHIPESNYRLVPDEQDIWALYQTIDAFMHLPISRSLEAWGQVCVEALASNIPLVCTESGIACDALIDGRDCLMVPYENAQSTAAALRQIHGDPDLCQNLATNGRQAIQQFSFSENDRLIEEVYGE